jgi:hypothetical protein
MTASAALATMCVSRYSRREANGAADSRETIASRAPAR